MPPVGSQYESPPVVKIRQIDRVRRLDEDERAGMQQLFLRARVIGRVRRNLGKRHMARRGNERLKRRNGDGSSIHPESADRHLVDRAFLRIVLVGAHAECAAGNPHHIGEGRWPGSCARSGIWMVHGQLWHRSSLSFNPRAISDWRRNTWFSSGAPRNPRHCAACGTGGGGNGSYRGRRACRSDDGRRRRSKSGSSSCGRGRTRASRFVSPSRVPQPFPPRQPLRTHECPWVRAAFCYSSCAFPTLACDSTPVLPRRVAARKWDRTSIVNSAG